jgi:hypothetical protein
LYEKYVCGDMSINLDQQSRCPQSLGFRCVGWKRIEASKQISCLSDTTNKDYFSVNIKHYNLSDIGDRDSFIQMYGPSDKEPWLKDQTRSQSVSLRACLSIYIYMNRLLIINNKLM